MKAVGFPSARLEYRAPTWKANIDRGPWDRGARLLKDPPVLRWSQEVDTT